MLIRFQFTEDTFTTLLRERLKAQDLCIDPLGAATFVDRITINELGAKIRNSTDPAAARHAWIPVVEFLQGTPKASSAFEVVGPRVEVVIPFTVDIVQLESLPQPWRPGEPVTPPLPVLVPYSPYNQVGLLVVISVDTSADGSALVLEFIDVEDPLGIVPNLDTINTILRSKIGVQHVPILDVPTLLGSLGFSGLSTAWSALAYNAQTEIVEIRLELESVPATYELESWQAFYQGNHWSILADGEDWAFFVDKDIMRSIVSTLFYQNLTHSSEFGLRSPVYTTWHADPEVVVAFNGVYFNACNCFFTWIDIEVSVEAHITFRVEPGQLVLDVAFSFSPDTLQESCCEVSLATLFPVIAALYVDRKTFGKEGGLIYVVGLLTWIFASPVTILGAAHAAVAAGLLPLPLHNLGAHCEQVDDKPQIVCKYPLPTTDPAGACDRWFPASRNLTAVRGTEAGLMLAGTLAIAKIAAADVDVESSDFTWTYPSPTCSGSKGELEASASIVVSDPGWTAERPRAPLYFCDAAILSPAPFSTPAFVQYVTESFTYCPLVTTIHIDIPRDLAPRDPVDVLVRTSAGVRIVRLEGITSEPDLDTWNAEALRWRAAHCYNAPDPWWKTFRRFNPQWLIDPAGPGERERHVWQIQMDGLPAQSRVRVMGLDDASLAERVVNSSGAASHAVIVAPGGETGEVGLVLDQQPAGERQQRQQRQHRTASTSSTVQIRQFQLVHVGSLQLAEDARVVGAIRIGSSRLLYIASPGVIEAFDMRDPSRPRLSDRATIPGMKDGSSYGAGFLVWGSAGLSYIGATLQQQTRADWFAADVLSASLLGEYVYLLSSGRLFILTQEGNVVHTSEASFARLDAVHGVLFATKPARIDVFEQAERGQLHRVSSIDGEGLLACRPGRFGPSKEVEVQRDDGTYEIFDISAPANPIPVARGRSDVSPGDLIACGELRFSRSTTDAQVNIEVLRAARTL